MTNNQIATAKNSEVTAAQIPNSQRFANKILKEFSDSAGNIQIGSVVSVSAPLHKTYAKEPSRMKTDPLGRLHID